MSDQPTSRFTKCAKLGDAFKKLAAEETDLDLRARIEATRQAVISLPIASRVLLHDILMEVGQ